jgi:hypothetical protein
MTYLRGIPKPLLTFAIFARRFSPHRASSAGLYRSRLIRLNRAEFLGQRGCETTQKKLATNLERAPIDTRPPDLRRSAVQELSVGGQKSCSTVAKHFTDRPRALPLSLRQVARGVQARQEWRSNSNRALAPRSSIELPSSAHVRLCRAYLAPLGYGIGTPEQSTNVQSEPTASDARRHFNRSARCNPFGRQRFSDQESRMIILFVFLRASIQ